MKVSNLTTAQIPLTVQHRETGVTSEVFIQPGGRVRLDPAHTVSKAARQQYAGLVFHDDAAPAPDAGSAD